MIDQEDVKVGTVVRHLGDVGQWRDDNAKYFALFTVVEDKGYDALFTEDTVERCAVQANPDLFDLALTEKRKELDKPCPFVLTDSISRPILAERKVGKVKMQLFDEGFPNAVMEIARVMTWAEENKGYKPNDFKSLPNADVEFPAAASRHRVKGFMQKADGVAPIDRVDEESGIVHLAHAAFNVLSELELILTGKIK